MRRGSFRRRDSAGRRAFIYISLLVLGAAAGLVSLLLATSGYGLPMFRSYFSSPMLLLLNLLPPILLTLLLYFIFGRAWAAVSVSSLIVLALSTAGFFLMQSRSYPLATADLFDLNEFKHMPIKFDFEFIWMVYVAAGIFVAALIISIFLLKGNPPRLMTRLICLALIIAVFWAAYVKLYTSETVYNGTLVSCDTGTSAEQQSYISRGIIYPFIYSVKDVAFVSAG